MELRTCAWVKCSFHDLTLFEMVYGRALPRLGLKNYALDSAFGRFVRSQRFISGFTNKSDCVRLFCKIADIAFPIHSDLHSFSVGFPRVPQFISVEFDEFLVGNGRYCASGNRRSSNDNLRWSR